MVHDTSIVLVSQNTSLTGRARALSACFYENVHVSIGPCALLTVDNKSVCIEARRRRVEDRSFVRRLHSFDMLFCRDFTTWTSCSDTEVQARSLADTRLPHEAEPRPVLRISSSCTSLPTLLRANRSRRPLLCRQHCWVMSQWRPAHDTRLIHSLIKWLELPSRHAV